MKLVATISINVSLKITSRIKQDKFYAKEVKTIQNDIFLYLY